MKCAIWACDGEAVAIYAGYSVCAACLALAHKAIGTYTELGEVSDRIWRARQNQKPVRSRRKGKPKEAA